jgi:hypothetical protein
MTNDKNFFQTAGSQVLAELSKTPYENEAVLQKALADAPEVIAGFTTTGDEPTRLLLIKKEMTIPAADNSGTLRVDHLYADATGVPVLVEVKRSTDLRLRREVVAQMLDYAASAAQEWPAEVIRDSLEQRAGLHKSVDELLSENEIPMTADVLISTITDNLSVGKIRMMFVADEITESLRRIIEFLNMQMSPAEVLGVEVPQYVGTEGTAYVPRLVGRTAAARSKKIAAGSGQPWDRDLFLDTARARCSDEQYELIVELLDQVFAANGRVVWGQGSQPGFGAWYEADGQQLGLWNLRAPGETANSQGRIEFRFSDLVKTRGFDCADSASAELEQIPGAHDRIAHSWRSNATPMSGSARPAGCNGLARLLPWRRACATSATRSSRPSGSAAKLSTERSTSQHSADSFTIQPTSLYEAIRGSRKIANRYARP